MSDETRTVLIVDDDPLQRRLACALFRAHGFRTLAAGDGAEALEVARAKRPAAIVSDLLMPGMDGMQLSLSVRASPDLAGVPVILISSYSTDQVDRELAGRMGAARFVSRSAGGGELVAAVEEALAQPVPEEWADARCADRIRGVALELERQRALNAALQSRCGLQAAALAALGAVSDCLLDNMAPDAAMALVLRRAVEASGLARGALYWRAAGGVMELRSAVGHGIVGRPEWLAGLVHEHVDAMLESDEPMVFPALGGDEELSRDVLDALGAASALVVPVSAGEDTAGMVVLASGDGDLTGREWIVFGRTLARQIGQATRIARAVERLRSSENLLHSIVENAGSVVFAKDLEGRYLLANSHFRKVAAVCGAPVGKTDHDLFPAAFADSFRAADRAVLENGEALTVEEKVPSPGGERVFVTVKFPLRDGAGRVYGLAGIATDITDRKVVEERLRHSARMEAVGQLAGGIAHDFNNIVSVILGHMDLIADHVGQASPAVVQSLMVMDRAARRAAGLTRQLLAFSRRQVMQPKVIHLGLIVKDVMSMVDRLIGEDIDVEVDISAPTSHVRADAGQIEQVVMNLAVNARDAMPRGGKLRVATRDAIVEAGDGTAGVPAGRYAVLVVSDTGCGMDEATLARIYEPFFTTKPRENGTGLGLATVYGIVKQSDGLITVDSAPGRGTRFTVWLPAVDRPLDLPDVVGRRSVRRGSETILLVEDEDDLRTLTQLVLQRQGYKVLVADSGAFARVLTDGYPQPIDLLLADVVLPGESGPETARHLTARRPQMKVLYMSGYTEETMLRHGLERNDRKLIAKPFSPEALVDRVRQALDAPAA